ncbi:hypothetical protein B0T20DRAFT_170635 [Sordaria brevicollis]|uniref:Uncharacterized protein n=1 Tax=Sordaria brevicollis TaxID=83679 RepID=A0AAE0PHG5_SORBR|nr:hypothetical protein B0T20DRAFT_170635 [Sordaria brevicollis]
MARRTTRGIKKSYVEAPIVFDDEDEPIPVTSRDSDDDEFAAPDPAQEEEEDKDEDADMAEPTSEEDDAEDEDDEDDGDVDGKKNDTSSQPKKHRNTGAGMIQSRKGFHDIPHYPLETRIVTRVYAGPLRRYARYSALRDSMYGPEYSRIKIIWDLEMRWAEFPALPPRYMPHEPQGICPSPWLAPGFERAQEQNAARWYSNYYAKNPEPQQSHLLSSHDGERLIPPAGGDLVTFIGPWDRQAELRFTPGQSLPITASGLPTSASEHDDKSSTGWMLDIGSIPLAMGWVPSLVNTKQVLAIASIPFADQEPRKQEDGADKHGAPDAMTEGCVQLWEFTPKETGKTLARPSATPARLIRTLCFNWGRPKRLEWCPVPYESVGSYGLLAILTGDGKARVVDVKVVEEGTDPVYEWVQSPVVTLGIDDDYNNKVTCLSWVNINRIALGHSDGSVTLWSVFPRKMLQRVGVHTTYVIDICSAYPSNPYLVASIPVGGCATLTDLSQPSSELTYFPVPAISFQPNMLCWNESMQGFMALYPSSTPNTTIAFLHHRFFCQARSICTGPNTITCISAGTTHPFVLAGCADGSLFSCNALQKLFKQKGEPLQKIKVMEHEYRPIKRPELQRKDSARPVRGAVRILQGFLPEPNDDPRTEKRKELDRKKKLERMKTASGKKKGRPRKNGGTVEDLNREAELDDKLASRVVTHEPLTRLTTIVWNPNLQYSCWAACAMASGIIKVMDLGVQ